LQRLLLLFVRQLKTARRRQAAEVSVDLMQQLLCVVVLAACNERLNLLELGL